MDIIIKNRKDVDTYLIEMEHHQSRAAQIRKEIDGFYKNYLDELETELREIEDLNPNHNDQ